MSQHEFIDAQLAEHPHLLNHAERLTGRDINNDGRIGDGAADTLLEKVEDRVHKHMVKEKLDEAQTQADDHTYTANTAVNALNAATGTNISNVQGVAVGTNQDPDASHHKTHALEVVTGTDLDGDGKVGSTHKHGATIDQVVNHLSNSAKQQLNQQSK